MNELKSIVDPPDWSMMPTPVDDGATRHLVGTPMAAVTLQGTNGQMVNMASLCGRTIIYSYPRTGQPGIDNPPGWDLIPGARGCTPQTCSFRDHFAELKALGIQNLFGLSTQTPEYQREAAERLHLPFAILSDERLELTQAMNLPSFETSGMTLLKRVTLVIDDGIVEHVLYPVFPPDRSASEVIAWLPTSRTAACSKSVSTSGVVVANRPVGRDKSGLGGTGGGPLSNPPPLLLTSCTHTPTRLF